MLNTLNEIESHLNHITDPTHQKMTLTNCSSKQFVDAHNNTCDTLHTMLNAQRIMLAYLKVMNSRLPLEPWKQDVADAKRYRSQSEALVNEGERYQAELDTKGLAKEPTKLWHPKQVEAYEDERKRVLEGGLPREPQINSIEATRITTLTPHRTGETVTYGLPHIDTEAEAMQLLMKCGYLCRCLTPLPFVKTFPAWCTDCRRIVPFDPDEREEPTR